MRGWFCFNDNVIVIRLILMRGKLFGLILIFIQLLKYNIRIPAINFGFLLLSFYFTRFS
jgi:hypothetical protein